MLPDRTRRRWSASGASAHLRRAPGSNDYVLGALEHWAEVFFTDGRSALYAGGAQEVRGFMLQQLGRTRSLVEPAA